MTKEHFKATGNGGVKSSRRIKNLWAMHPDDVDPSDIAGMNDREFNDFLVALDLVEDYRTIPRSARPSSQL